MKWNFIFLAWIIVVAVYLEAASPREWVDRDFLADIECRDKIYLPTENLLMCPEGLYVSVEENLIELHELHHDADGFYILPPQYWCDKGHRTLCWMCEGCDVWWCTCRCRCGP